MPILDATQGSDFERVSIPASTYKAVLVAVKSGQINDVDNPGQKKDVLFWAFEITGKSKTVTVEGMTSVIFKGEKSKSRQWARVLMGQEPPLLLDTDDLLGKECKVVVVDKTSNGETFSRVENVITAHEAEL